MMKTLKYFGLILILSIAGFLTQNDFFNFSFSQIENEKIQFVSLNMSGQFYSQILFALSIGIIPLFYFFIQKMTKLEFINQGLISCGIIIVSGISFWQFRILQLKSQLQQLSNVDNGNEIQLTFNIENLNFSHYLFIGFLVGTILSVLIFKKKNKEVIE